MTGTKRQLTHESWRLGDSLGTCPFDLSKLVGGGVMQEHLSLIWLGLFGPNAPETYFVQTYVDEDVPQCQFGTDQSQSFFDDDFVEISFPIEPQSVRDLVKWTQLLRILP
jgi:hypothetical protein